LDEKTQVVAEKQDILFPEIEASFFGMERSVTALKHCTALSGLLF